MRRARLATVALLLVGTSLVSGGCGGSTSAADEATATKKIAQLPADLVPKDVLGLSVSEEDMTKTLAGVNHSYADGVGLYSFRSGELLQATLQVTRFNSHARYTDSSFRRLLVNQIGGSLPREVRLGDETVYLTRGTKQSLSVWFRGRYFLVLSVREDYNQPRALLREALRIQP